MANICKKCGKSFTTSYNLNRHLLRKTPCTKPPGFACEKCEKVFKSRSCLEVHTNKKKSCLKKPSDAPQNHLTFEQQKELLELSHKQALKIIEAKKKSILEIEKEKTARKIQTPHVVNNYENFLHLEIHELKILNATFPAKNIHDADLSCLKKIIPALDRKSKSCDIAELVCKDKELDEIEIELIEKTYNNDALPNQRNMIYSDESKTFYIVKDSSWVESDFENIKELMSQTLHKYYKVLYKKSAGLTKPSKKSQEVYIKIKEYATADLPISESKKLENVAMKALNRAL